MSADLSTSYGERVAQIRLELEQAIMAGAAAHTRVHLRRLRTVVDAATAVGVDTAGREWSTPTDGEVRARVAVVIAARIPDVLPTFPVSLLERLPEQQRRQVLEFESAWTTLPRERRAAAYLKWCAVLCNWGEMRLHKALIASDLTSPLAVRLLRGAPVVAEGRVQVFTAVRVHERRAGLVVEASPASMGVLAAVLGRLLGVQDHAPTAPATGRVFLSVAQASVVLAEIGELQIPAAITPGALLHLARGRHEAALADKESRRWERGPVLHFTGTSVRWEGQWTLGRTVTLRDVGPRFEMIWNSGTGRPSRLIAALLAEAGVTYTPAARRETADGLRERLGVRAA